LFLVDFSKMFEPFLSGLNGMQGIYDQHLVPLVEVGDQLNSRAFFNKSESNGSENGYLSAVFYDVGNVSIGNKTYYTLLLKFDQSYKRAIRLYMIRLFIISI